MKLRTRTNQPVEGDELGNSLKLDGSLVAEGVYARDSKITGNLEVTGDAKLFENIVDAQGHKRFIEGNLTGDVVDGLSYLYNKWSLSGTHLMIVCALQLDTNASITGGTKVVNLNDLPDWIKDKIVSSTTIPNRVATTVVSWESAGQTATNDNARLIKTSEDLYIDLTSLPAVAYDRYARFTFDLLIDNETPESQGE